MRQKKQEEDKYFSIAENNKRDVEAVKRQMMAKIEMMKRNMEEMQAKMQTEKSRADQENDQIKSLSDALKRERIHLDQALKDKISLESKFAEQSQMIRRLRTQLRSERTRDSLTRTFGVSESLRTSTESTVTFIEPDVSEVSDASQSSSHPSRIPRPRSSYALKAKTSLLARTGSAPSTSISLAKSRNQ